MVYVHGIKVVRRSHTVTQEHVRGSELVVVSGQILSVVGGLTSNKHVPVLKNLFFGQHLILKKKKKKDIVFFFHTSIMNQTFYDVFL